MRRWFVVLVALAVISAACAGDSGGPPSTEAQTTSGVTVPTSGLVGPSTTVPADTPTTDVAPEWPAVEVLVTNDDGVFLIDTEGEITRLVKGRVAYAVDDTRGGLLFQVERGRSYGERATRLADLDTRVWWVPRGSAQAQELLVPTPGTDQALALHDAIETEDGRTHVVYLRSDDPKEYRNEDDRYPGIHEDRIDRLRIYDVDSQTVTEAAALHIFEQGISTISAGDDQVVVMFHNQVGKDCALLDMSTGIEPPASRAQGVWAQSEWAPWIDAGCEGDQCPDSCTLSPSGGLFGYTMAGQTLVVDATTGEERLSRDGLLVDLSDTYVLVDDGHLTLVVPVKDPSGVTMVPVAGVARFVKTAVRIEGPIVPPTPAAIQLRADGLGVVDLGDVPDSAMRVMQAVLGRPTVDVMYRAPFHRDEQGWPPPMDVDPAIVDERYEDIGCFAATGYPCRSFIRYAEWSDAGIVLTFSDVALFGDGSREPGYLNGWHLSQSTAGASSPSTTDDGVGLGSSFDDLVRLLGDQVWSSTYRDECSGEWRLMSDGLSVYLSGSPFDEGAIVTWLGGGFYPDPC